MEQLTGNIAILVAWRLRPERVVELFFQRRPLSDQIGDWIWEFPGGKQVIGETLAECACREFKEEVGQRVLKEDVVFYKEFNDKFAIYLLKSEIKDHGVKEWVGRWQSFELPNLHKIQGLKTFCFNKEWLPELIVKLSDPDSDFNKTN